MPSLFVLPNMEHNFCRGLRSRSCFAWDKTRRDWRSLPELVVHDKTTWIWSRGSGNPGKNPGKFNIQNGTTRESLEELQKLINLGKRSGIPECFPTWNKMGRSQSRMAGLIWDWEEDVPKCLIPYFSHFLREISGSWEMAFGNADLYFFVMPNMEFTLDKCNLSIDSFLTASCDDEQSYFPIS